MAISKTVETPEGLIASGAYHRINRMEVFRDGVMDLFVFTYATSAADKMPILRTIVTAPYDPDGANPFIQGYNYLKTTAQFAGASDC